jgi:hypothetical protein
MWVTSNLWSFFELDLTLYHHASCDSYWRKNLAKIYCMFRNSKIPSLSFDPADSDFLQSYTAGIRR